MKTTYGPEMDEGLAEEFWSAINQHLSEEERVCPVIRNLMKNLGDPDEEGINQFKRYIVSDFDEERMNKFEDHIASECPHYAKKRSSEYADSVCYTFPNACILEPFKLNRSLQK